LSGAASNRDRSTLISEMKDMAEQNRRLKKKIAEMSMQNELLKGKVPAVAV